MKHGPAIQGPLPTAHLLPLQGTEPTSHHFQLQAPFSKTSPVCSEVLELKLCVTAQGPSQRSTLTTLPRDRGTLKPAPQSSAQAWGHATPSSLPPHTRPSSQGPSLARGPFRMASRAPEACS